jgi:hypothetical protein
MGGYAGGPSGRMRVGYGKASRGQRRRDLVPQEEEIGIVPYCVHGNGVQLKSKEAVTRERRVGPVEICTRPPCLRTKNTSARSSKLYFLQKARPSTYPLHLIPPSTMSPIALPTQNAVVLHGPKDLRLEERTLWPPQYNYAQVSVVCTGLCGSDCQSLFFMPVAFHIRLTLSRT